MQLQQQQNKTTIQVGDTLLLQLLIARLHVVNCPAVVGFADAAVVAAVVVVVVAVVVVRTRSAIATALCKLS